MAVIVTAEDDPDIRAITTRLLERAGHSVIATVNGADGLAAVHAHHPDAVITDMDMPRLTGLELCRAVRDDPDLRHIPVLLVSGSIDLTARDAADAGITAILGKPFKQAELLKHVDN